MFKIERTKSQGCCYSDKSKTVKEVFPNTRHVGCLFHFIKNIRLNLLKLGLYNEEIKEKTYNLLKAIGQFPFKYNDNNNNIIEQTFNYYEKIYEDGENKNIFIKFKEYFLNSWKYYFIN